MLGTLLQRTPVLVAISSDISGVCILGGLAMNKSELTQKVSIDPFEVINPRRACAARVTVLGLSVCPSVRLSVCPSVRLLPRFLPPRATNR